MKSNNSDKTALVLIICSIVLCIWGTISTGCSEEEPIGKTPVQQVAEDALPLIGMDAYEALLEDSLPNWDDSLLTRPADASTSSFLETDGVELLGEFTEQELDLIGTTSRGDTIYTNEANTAALKLNFQKGYWKYVSPKPAINPSVIEETISDDDALLLAESLFDAFDLPEAERGGHVAVGVGAALMGPEGVLGEKRTQARHVRLFREVNGLKVRGSHLMSTYSLEGAPFRVEVRWPVFNVDETASLATQEQAIEEIAAAVSEDYPSISEIESVRSELCYWFDEETTLFEPTLLVSVFIDGEPDVKSIRYSLTNGLWSPPDVFGEE